MPCRCSCLILQFFFVVWSPVLPYPPPRYSRLHPAAWKISYLMKLDWGGWNDAKTDSWVGRKQRSFSTHGFYGLPFVPVQFCWCCWVVWDSCVASGSIPDYTLLLLFSCATISWPFLTIAFSTHNLVHPIFSISSVERERYFINKDHAEGHCNCLYIKTASALFFTVFWSVLIVGASSCY